MTTHEQGPCKGGAGTFFPHTLHASVHGASRGYPPNSRPISTCHHPTVYHSRTAHIKLLHNQAPSVKPFRGLSSSRCCASSAMCITAWCMGYSAEASQEQREEAFGCLTFLKASLPDPADHELNPPAARTDEAKARRADPVKGARMQGRTIHPNVHVPCPLLPPTTKAAHARGCGLVREADREVSKAL